MEQNLAVVGYQDPPPRVRTRPVVVQHSAGRPGANGPLTVLERVLASRLANEYDFVRMHQDRGNGAIDRSLLRGWVSLLRRIRPDLVHVRGLQNEGFLGVLAARLAGCPRILVTVHGTVRDLHRGGRSLRRRLLVHGAEPMTLRAATHVATVCEYAAGRDFLTGCRDRFVGVIPNGVLVPEHPGPREQVRAALDLQADDVVMITVGRMTWEKGYGVLADALRRLPVGGGRHVLLVVGDGPDAPAIATALHAAADAASPGSLDVRLLGARADVPELLAAADLFVFPTLHENLSNALLEAMAQRLPVVASAVGGNVEVLRDGAGLLVPAADPGALAAAIAPLLNSSTTRADLADRAYRRVRDRYSLDAMLDRLDAVYRQILAA
ncbi:glycosyltransferase [Micromonospora sp. WMMD1155]|uniref:glycosyltransferase n=1 Tax=Micromonospora sp. WMMD1155 TaxID=3016094 RepID=UPI00249AF06B|nr:glycosyltransferase [Micromonospora sp. WMMD1155]WFE49211.1 glycosyltransferase [Micromonospora sp. WMMD1155]